ncbi:bifunctional 3-demethylubiquinol 3-O-methyltransferase/2-polyprenyl-6-hydroxyphenol methylase, partial [Legionella pneumophila serogroup 1]
IKPSELVKMARLYDLNLIDMKGLCYNPFLRKTTLVSDVSINYIMVLQ